MASTDIRRIVERIQNLPTLPTVVTRILNLVKSPESCAQDLEEILSKDQSLTTKVMRLVNSSFYGYAGKITTLKQAVVILGFETIRSIALTASVFSAFPNRNRALFDRESFWKHSIATGVASRLLAQAARDDSAEDVFLAGIVHDIGKVVLDEYAPAEFDQVLQLVAQKDCLIYEAEREVLGSSHAQIGRWLATKWALPAELTDVIFYHHQPGNSQRAPRWTAFVHVGDILARTLKLGSGGDLRIPPLDPSGWSLTGLDQATLKKVLANLPAEFAKADIFVQMTKS